MSNLRILLYSVFISIPCLHGMDESLSTPQAKSQFRHISTPAYIEAVLSGSLSEETLRAVLSLIKEEDSRRTSLLSSSRTPASPISSIKATHAASQNLDSDPASVERVPTAQQGSQEAEEEQGSLVTEATIKKWRWTPLHKAAWEGDIETAARLILDGATLEAASSGDLTPLHLATYNKQTQVALLLIGAGASIMLRDTRYGATPFHNACYSGDEKVVTLMLSFGPNLDVQTDAGSTLLHCAAWHNHAGVTRLLVQHGAQLIANKKGLTALDIAYSKKFPDVIAVLKHLQNTSSDRDK